MLIQLHFSQITQYGNWYACARARVHCAKVCTIYLAMFASVLFAFISAIGAVSQEMYLMKAQKNIYKTMPYVSEHRVRHNEWNGAAGDIRFRAFFEQNNWNT